MASRTRTPSSKQPRLARPPPFSGPHQPSSPTSSPILLLTLGLWPTGGSRRHPTLLYPGLFQAPTPSLHPGTGDSSTPRPPSPISGTPAASELSSPIQSLPVHVTGTYLPSSLGTGLTTPNPAPHSGPPNCTEGSWEHRAFGLPRTPLLRFHTPLPPCVVRPLREIGQGLVTRTPFSRDT